MALKVFTATVTSGSKIDFVDDLLTDDSVTIVLQREDNDKKLIFNFLLNSPRYDGQDVLLDLAENLQNILDAFVVKSRKPFQVETTVDERAVESYYKRRRRNHAWVNPKNVVDWVKKSAPLYSRAFLNGKKELKGKTALEISTGESVNVSTMLNSDINYIAIFVAVSSGDGIGNFTVVHRDSFTPEAMEEAKRFGCQRVNDEDSFLPDRPYIDLQSLGAEFGILVPEREVIEMIRGEKRIYAVIPGIRTYPAMANAYFAATGEAEMGGLHCQEMGRQYAVSHLVPCLRSEASTVTGKKCVPTNNIYREKKKGKSCAPLLTHEQQN
ncbi:MAG: hypothetical protein ACPG77_15545, partial [Nannocystaceae bacterium]